MLYSDISVGTGGILCEVNDALLTLQLLYEGLGNGDLPALVKLAIWARKEGGVDIF